MREITMTQNSVETMRGFNDAALMAKVSSGLG